MHEYLFQSRRSFCTELDEFPYYMCLSLDTGLAQGGQEGFDKDIGTQTEPQVLLLLHLRQSDHHCASQLHRDSKKNSIISDFYCLVLIKL